MADEQSEIPPAEEKLKQQAEEPTAEIPAEQNEASRSPQEVTEDADRNSQTAEEPDQQTHNQEENTQEPVDNDGSPDEQPEEKETVQDETQDTEDVTQEATADPEQAQADNADQVPVDQPDPQDQDPDPQEPTDAVEGNAAPDEENGDAENQEQSDVQQDTAEKGDATEVPAGEPDSGEQDPVDEENIPTGQEPVAEQEDTSGEQHEPSAEQDTSGEEHDPSAEQDTSGEEHDPSAEQDTSGEQHEPSAEQDTTEPTVNENNNAGGDQDGQSVKGQEQQEADTARTDATEPQEEPQQAAEAEETDTKGQQTTQSLGAPTPQVQNNAEEAVQEEDEGQEDDLVQSPRIEDKGTPEPPTEDIGTGTEPSAHAPSLQPAEEAHPPSLQPVEEAHVPIPMPYDKDATATVKFVLLPTQQVATLRCCLTQTLYELKQHFASELKISESTILLMIEGKSTGDRITLGELGVGPNGTIRLEMQSADPENQPIKAFKPRQEYTMPDVISVRVHSDGSLKDIVVEIERATRKKPFLGGYRHKKTNVEYHHASAQTMQKPRPPPAVERFCRDTQTVQQKHILQQTTNDMSTQMTKIGVFVSNMRDMLLVPGEYTTADDFLMNQLNKVIIIQKYYRRWLAQRYVEKVREDKAEREEYEKEEELRKKKEKEDRIRREFERRMNPKSKEDFDLLYHALEKWRQEEMNRINEMLSGAERKAALCQLLDQETQLIASIGRHKLEADGENKDKYVQAFLDKASSAKKWRGPDGKHTEMDTPYTIRAQELKDIYNSINMKYLTQDERLDVLLTLKHTVKEHDCKLTSEIIELIDREADLLMRGVKESNLEGLRKRISTLFLQYIKTPTFNPEAARLLKVPQDPSVLRKNIYFCPSCNQYLASTEFQLASNSQAVGKCRKCSKMDNDARVRQDYSHYRYMTKSIRRAEESFGDESKIAYLMQESDLRYLVENVWNSQSVLSAWEDLYDLVLVRWDCHEEWSPWNCILLTKDEASAHEKLVDLEEAYGKVFIHKVKHKHTLARNYFSRMPGMAEHMRNRNTSAMPNGPAVSGKSLPIASAKA